MGRLTLILGGARSGKSSYAQGMTKKLEEERGGGVIYLATAAAGDQEMRARIEQHRRQRPGHWKTVEVPLDVPDALRSTDNKISVIIVDCLTLLIANLLAECEAPGSDHEPGGVTHLDAGRPNGTNRKRSDKETTERILTSIGELIEAARSIAADVIIVSNEVGMGVVPPSHSGRLFRDIAGLANQRLAQAADGVVFMIAGLPQLIKAQPS